jgi:hypothetical protein
MKYFLMAIISLLGLQVANAQTAIYQDGMLTIPTIGVIEGTGATYYSNIQLQLEPDGDFKLMASSPPHHLVGVESVVASVMGSLQVHVSLLVSGYKSVPCVSLLEPAIARRGSTFVVILAESTMGPAETCIAVIDPFETNISLDVSGLSAGTYGVEVNEFKTSFTLVNDNP